MGGLLVHWPETAFEEMGQRPTPAVGVSPNRTSEAFTDEKDSATGIGNSEHYAVFGAVSG
jgi:hypothetical protein